MKILRKPKIGHPEAGYEQLAYAALSVALSYLAGKLLAKKQGPIDTDKPTTLTRRGSHANYLIGIQRLGPIFACAPLTDREYRKEKASGGKGAGGTDQNIYYEVGWHVIGSNGPYYALHEIIQGGKTIFRGPITRDSHPSGSTIDLGKEGSFTIYWGEETQPINTFLGDANRVGVNSRWRFLCYVVWNKKRLGSSPQWPVLDYVMEQRPLTTLLTDSDMIIEPTESLTGATKTIIGHTNGVEGTGRFTFSGAIGDKFFPGTPVQLSGNSMTGGRYVSLRTETYQSLIFAGTSTTPAVYVTLTDVYLYGGVTGANNAGTLQQYVLAEDGGINPAHGIAEMLFAQWPNGLGRDTGGVEPWDLDSLEALGVEAETDRFVSVWLGVDGEKFDAILGAGLQDLGVMVPIEYSAGKIQFVPIRVPSGTLPNISYAMQAGRLVETEKILDDKEADRLVFSFSDRANSWADMTITVDEDGQASYLEYQSATEVGIKITTDFHTAGLVSERRSQEVLAGTGAVTIPGNRGCRELIPGQAILVDGFDDVMRVVGVQIEPLEETVTVRCLLDYYGVRKTDFENSTGGGTGTLLDAEPDLQAAIVEVPETLLQGGTTMTIIVPRIRAHNQTVGADIHLSRDNTTYTLNSEDVGVVTGGTLDTAFTDSSPAEEANGPTFTVLGPDIATALDLSADPTNWRLGRQLCVISSSAGTEICFLQKPTAMGGSTYRMDGLIRARYDTSKLNHPIGAEVYILEQTDVASIQDILLVPNTLLYVKTQPQTGGGAVPLDAISPEGTYLYGKGLKPMALVGIDVTAPALGSPSYATGQDLSFRIDYRAANETTSSAGAQPSGTICGVQVPKGTITLEFLTTADVLKKTVALPAGTNVYTYTNATLIADFGSELSMHVRATHTVSGYSTDPITITVTKV